MKRESGFFIVLVGAMAMAACPGFDCTPTCPDSTPPVATLVVNGTVTSTGDSAPKPMVIVTPGQKFTVGQLASDACKINQLQLDWKYYVVETGQLVQGSGGPVAMGCAQQLVNNTQDFPWQNQNRKYVFKLTALDCDGTNNTTPELTVCHSTIGCPSQPSCVQPQPGDTTPPTATLAVGATSVHNGGPPETATATAGTASSIVLGGADVSGIAQFVLSWQRCSIVNGNSQCSTMDFAPITFSCMQATQSKSIPLPAGDATTTDQLSVIAFDGAGNTSTTPMLEVDWH